LNSIQTVLIESVDRLAASDTSDSISELLHKELTLLREQNSRSGRVISTLSKSLERSRERARELEKHQRKNSGGHGSVNTELEAGYRRLAQENKALHVRITKAAEKHQIALQLIGDKLRASEEKYRSHVSQANDRQQSMQSIINQLREQLREADGQQMDAARIDQLMARIKEMDNALDRALRERDFLDERYVELEQALSVSQDAVQELERAKVEYRMLEERYLEMEEQIDKSISEERKRNHASEIKPVAYREKGIDVITDDFDQP
jgi:chromosome segregation ATPase